MNASSILLLLLVLACPLMMVFMHRPRRGARASQGGHGPHESLDDLRRRRDEIDAEIAKRESVEQSEPGLRPHGGAPG